MEQQRVVSREYKVMLRPELFTGAENAVLAEAHALWQDVVERIGEVVVQVDGDLSRIKARRLISFFDTRDHRLDEAHYIFRERRATDGSKREVTLKFRHPDSVPRTGPRHEGEIQLRKRRSNLRKTSRARSCRCTASRRRSRSLTRRSSPLSAT